MDEASDPQGPEKPDEAAARLSGLEEAVRASDRAELLGVLEGLHPADASDVLEQLEAEAFGEAIALLGDELSSDVLIELRGEYLENAVEALPDSAIVSAIGDLDTDDATWILESLSDDRRERILGALEPGDRTQLESALTFDEETAGRLMQREFVAAPEFWTVGHTIDHARATGDALPDHFFEVYVVDPGFKVKGAVPLGRLLRAPREVLLSAIMSPVEAEIETGMDQEEVAFLFQKYSLVSAPVVDGDGRITGMITVDDMVDVIQSENTEDLLALSGVSKADSSSSAWDAVRARAPWLGVNLVTAFVASGIISVFEHALAELVALAILMPVVAALGGNAGSQALAVTVRAISEREMEGAAASRAVRREFLTGLMNGVIFALGVGAIAWTWFRDPLLSATIAAAILVTFTFGCLSGILVPLTLKRLGTDPAVASSVFVLTLPDITAFASFLGLSSWVLL